MHKFCAIDIFWNIARRQAISTVSKSHHVCGRGLMIQRVILLFIRCFSGKRNQSFFLHESILLHFMFEFSLAIISEMLSNGTKNNQQRNKHSLFSLEGLHVQLTFFLF